MMERIADDVVSYEHGTRLEYVGKAACRVSAKPLSRGHRSSKWP
jgi:hypothetical protein